MLGKPFLRSILLLSAVLLGSTSAGRLDDVARRGGFHPQALRDLEIHARALPKEQEKVEHRYLTSETKSVYDLRPLWALLRADKRPRVLRRVASRDPTEFHDRNVQWSDAYS